MHLSHRSKKVRTYTSASDLLSLGAKLMLSSGGPTGGAERGKSEAPFSVMPRAHLRLSLPKLKAFLSLPSCGRANHTHTNPKTKPTCI